MTPEEHEKLDRILVDQERILAEQERFNRFFFEPYMADTPTRAEQLDRLLRVQRSSKIAWKMAVWVFSAASAVAAFVITLQKIKWD